MCLITWAISGHLKSNHFIGLRSSKDYYKDHVGWRGYMGRVIWVLREWVVRGGGLDGYFGKQGLPVGIQEGLERFHRGCVDYLSWQFVSK